MRASKDSRDQITEFGIELMTLSDTQNVLELISTKAKDLLNTQRCSIFVVDEDDRVLWTKLSDGIEMIVIPLDSGVVGETYESKKPQLVNEPYSHPKFMQNIDEKRGFVTKNIITMPIFDSQQKVIAIIQLLNKLDSDFNENDLETLTFFSNFVSGSLELSLMSDWFESS